MRGDFLQFRARLKQAGGRSAFGIIEARFLPDFKRIALLTHGVSQVILMLIGGAARVHDQAGLRGSGVVNQCRHAVCDRYRCQLISLLRPDHDSPAVRCAVEMFT